MRLRTQRITIPSVLALSMVGCVRLQPDGMNECVPFEPMTVTETIMGQWSGPDDRNEHTLTVPVEPAAGILKVQLLPGPLVGPRLTARMGGGATTLAEDDGLEAGTTAQVAFEVGPGTQVDLEAVSAQNAPAGDYPVAYQIVWTYSGRADCYEPNDTMEDAKTIPADTEIEAYLLFKRRGNEHVNTEHDDWYRFTLGELSAVRVRLLDIPADVSARFDLFDVNGNPLRSATASQPGTLLSLDAGDLLEGEYVLRVRGDAFSPGANVAIGIGGPSPEHFDETYRFRVETLAPISTMLDECMPFEPMTVTNTIAAEWSEPNDSNEHSFTVPAEPSAGIVDVRLIPDSRVGPKLAARMRGDAGVIADDGGLDRGTTARVAFEVGPGQQVDLDAVSSLNALPEEYPLSYQIVWTYSGRADCYEPNDTMEMAKAVPTDTDLEAYFLFKRDDNMHVLTEHDDWYRFTLVQAVDLSVHLLDVPDDTRASLHVFDATGSSVRGVPSQVFGGLVDLDAGNVSPGTYFLRVRAGNFDSGSIAVGTDDPKPAHFDSTYRFRISRN